MSTYSATPVNRGSVQIFSSFYRAKVKDALHRETKNGLKVHDPLLPRVVVFAHGTPLVLK
jgi:hypothetical protein